MAGISTQGAQIRVGSGASPQVWTDIGCVTDFSGPSGSRQVIDTTCLDSAGRGKNVGIPDFGQITFNLIFDTDDTTQTDLWDSFVDGTSNIFRIIIPTSPEHYIEFDGYVLSFSYSANIDDVVRASVSIEIDGGVTYSF